ncbi:hypothetical protein [Microbulbifer sp. PSTR4-B]|uniref:hypothetical protein n=1 Tax=Microbulbifer sp. PSTR4-B TaxID=3243396 RepID=UPI004039A481
MSALAALVAVYDEAALTAVLSKGVVIRARKDVSAGKVLVRNLAEESANVEVDGVSLTLDSKDLTAARCTCSATGLCRHIAAAVLYLRETDSASSIEPALPSDVFTIELVEKFSGKDWPHALAMIDEPVSIITESSTNVSFIETNETVTFPAGMAVQKALYKGSVNSRKTRVVAAAALILLRNSGVIIPECVITESRVANREVLDAAAEGLAQAAQALSSSTVALARERLFSLAISTRAEAIPRLAAELRSLSQRLNPERLRRAEEKPVDLFYSLARTFALTEALRVAPSDPSLIGVLARNFIPTGPMRLTFLGAEHWRTPSGSRGFTGIFLNLVTNRIHRVVEARGAGVDIKFRPCRVWQLPLWALAEPEKMAGREILLEDATCAHDGSLGLTQRAIFNEGEFSFNQLESTGAVIEDWKRLPEWVYQEQGRGLRQRAGEMYVILKPYKVDVPRFDPLEQRWIWTWQDAQSEEIVLCLPNDIVSNIDTITLLLGRVNAGLVAISPLENGRRGRVIALYLSGKACGWKSLQFEKLYRPRGFSGVAERFKERAVPRSVSTPGVINPLSLFYERLAEAALACLNGSTISDRLFEDARALGQTHIMSILEQMRETGMSSVRPVNALRLAYLLSEGARRSK